MLRSWLPGLLLGTVFTALGVGSLFSWFQAVALRPQDDPNVTPAAFVIPAEELADRKGSYVTEVSFPIGAAKSETAWRIEWRIVKDQKFEISRADFRPGPGKDYVQVLGPTALVEVMVAYTDGTRYYDLKGLGFKLTQVEPHETGPRGRILDKEKRVIGEIRDRGLMWKHAKRSRRGESLVLWSALLAANYDYISEFTFQDDGAILGRMGSTGQNHGKNPGPDVGHMHSALWRIDIDLAGRETNKPFLVRHIEPLGSLRHSKDVVEPFNQGIEGFHDWKGPEFTTVRIMNPDRRNAKGNAACYDFTGSKTGQARHFGDNEAFTQHDFWITPFAEAEQDYTQLAKYVNQGRSIQKDIVLWYMSSSYHLPRDEDYHQGQPGVAMVFWSGFELRPRNLFDSTPYYQP